VILGPLLEMDEVVITREDMTTMFNLPRDESRLRRALASGLLVDLGDDRYRMVSRHVLEAARALGELGMPVLDLYELQLEVTQATRDIARRFVETSLDCALHPYDGTPGPGQWDEVRARFDHLRRLTASMLLAVFAVNVRQATEEILAERGRGEESSSG
jgi:hypothetical protein